MLSDEVYAWDLSGNPTGLGYVLGTDNRLLSDSTYRYSYDAEGNRTARFIDADNDGVLDAGDTSITECGWDNRNRLVEITDRAVFGGCPTQVVDYLFDMENRWIGSLVDSNGDGLIDQQTRFAYDGTQIALQFDKAGPADVAAADLSHRYLFPARRGGSTHGGLATFGDDLRQIPTGHDLTAPGTVVLPLPDHLGTGPDRVRPRLSTLQAKVDSLGLTLDLHGVIGPTHEMHQSQYTQYLFDLIDQWKRVPPPPPPGN